MNERDNISFEAKTERLSNYRRRTDVTDIIRTSSSYIILKWHTDEEIQAARTFKEDQQGTGKRHLF